jgi:hypothetical protein
MKIIEDLLNSNPETLYVVIGEKLGNDLYKKDFEDFEELKEDVMEFVNMLEPGSYIIELGTSKTDPRRKKRPFRIGSTNQERTKTNNTMTFEDIDRIKKEAYDQGHKDAQIMILSKRVSDLESDFKIFKQKVANKFDELDGNKDNDILDKAPAAVEAATGLMDLMKNFKS